MRDFRELIVWQKSRIFVKDTFEATVDFPKSETYGLVSQYRRAAVSIVGNIAEGCGKYTNPDIARYFQIAEGSAFECGAYIIVAFDLGFITQKQYDKLNNQIIEIQKILNTYISKVRTSS